MSFDTERPKTAEQQIQSLLETRKRRAMNLKTLAENTKNEQNTAQTQSVLESVLIQQKQSDAVTESLNKIKQKRAHQQFTEKTTIGKLTLLENAKTTVMNKVLFEMVYDAYWLDSDVKESTIQESYNTYRDIIGVVEEVCGKSKVADFQKTDFIKAVEEAVSEICTKAVDRIITEAKETGETDIKFNLTTEEEAELDTKLSDLGRDDIVDLVKDKVLTVVQDERECGKEKASILQELNDTDNDEAEDTIEDDETPTDTEAENMNVEEGAAYERTMCYDVYVPVSEGILSNLKHNKELRKEAKALLDSIGSSIGFKKESKLFNEGMKALHKRQGDEAIKKYKEYISVMSDLKKKIASAKGDYSNEVIKVLQNSCDMEISLTKGYIEQTAEVKKRAVTESYEVVTEEAATVAFTVAVLGVVVAAVAISAKERVELKKALKIYEKNCKPAIKMSELTPKLYEIDNAHRATNSELIGIKKLLKQGSQRAKVWRDSKGDIVCTAILYTTTKITPGMQVNSSNGVSPTLDIQRTAHYLYDVSNKYKKDALYLAAYMAFSDNYSTDNSRALTNDIKKAFKDEMKNTKVKFFGKSLESTGILEHVSPAFVEYDSVCELMEECGVTGVGADATYMCAMNETDPQRAIKLFGEYKDILQQGKTSVLLAPSDKYSHKVKTTVTNAINTQQQMCDTNIDKITKQMNATPVQSTDDIITSMKQQNIRRVINRTGSGTLFESMMVANTKKTTEAAVTEGMDINQGDAINAALIESILQYTVLETLNTLKLYNFTDKDVTNLKARNKASVK